MQAFFYNYVYGTFLQVHTACGSPVLPFGCLNYCRGAVRKFCLDTSQKLTLCMLQKVGMLRLPHVDKIGGDVSGLTAIVTGSTRLVRGCDHSIRQACAAYILQEHCLPTFAWVQYCTLHTLPDTAYRLPVHPESTASAMAVVNQNTACSRLIV